MLVHELKKNTGHHAKSKRLGRGDASGKGNYSTRGLKGQKSRSGGSIPASFEGGQTPLHRRLPKLRGFKRHYKLQTTVQTVNIGRLDADDKVADKATITKEQLAARGYIRSATGLVKLLGNTKLTKALSFEDIDAISANAQDQVEAAGGSVGELNVKNNQQQQQ